MQQSVFIASRFNGPPNCGNGGYVGGVIAQNLKGPVEVSLKAPTPLERTLLLNTEGDTATLLDGDKVIGVGVALERDLDAKALPVNMMLADSPLDGPEMEGKFQPFSNCFVCGAERSQGDGLCLESRCLEGHTGVVAAEWILDPSFAGEDGFIDPVYVWAALDCPGYFSCAAGEAALLAKYTVDIIAPIKAEGKAIVLGWDKTEDRTGRKRLCGTALYRPDGTLIAKAEGLWIAVDIEKIKA